MQFEKVFCPSCGKFLLEKSADVTGHIKPFCKGCRRPVIINLQEERCVRKKANTDKDN